MEQIEAAVDHEPALRRLEREIAGDERLDDVEREFALNRIAFYLDDMHAKRRAAERQSDILTPEL